MLKSTLDEVERRDRPTPRWHPLAPRPRTSRTSCPTTRCCRPGGASGSWRCAPSTGPARPGVLRTQLKIVHEAAARRRWRADRQRRRRRLSLRRAVTGHVAERRPAQGDRRAHPRPANEGADGELKSRICALVFLISQIPSRTIGGETGLRATAPFLADLLVEDLADDGARLRKRVPELLDELVDRGPAHALDDEYRLQTEEGAEWEKDYRSRAAAIRDDAARMNQLRSERLIARRRQRARRAQADPWHEQDAAQDRPATGARTTRRSARATSRCGSATSGRSPSRR